MGAIRLVGAPFARLLAMIGTPPDTHLVREADPDCRSPSAATLRLPVAGR